jgi:hypothetical protein
VLDTWDEFIGAYAATCACGHGIHGDCLGFKIFSKDPDGAGYYRLESGGTLDECAMMVGSGSHWVEGKWGVVGGNDWDVKAIMTCDNGETYSSAPTVTEGIIIRPCCEVSFWAKAKVEEPDRDQLSLAGDFWPIDAVVECTTHNENSPFYEMLWDYVWSTATEHPCEGVPGSSDELKDYLENCGQQAKNVLLSELPEALV